MSSQPRITAIHGSIPVIDITSAAFKESFPEAHVRHLLDSALNDDLDGTDAARERLEDRLADLINGAIALEPTAVLVTCSSYPRLVDEFLPGAARWAGLPVLRPDAGMYAEIRATGASRLAVLTTLQDAANAATYSVKRAFEEEPFNVHTHVIDRAARDPAQALADAADVLVTQYDIEAIALAQYSLAPAAARVAHAVSIPVFTGPVAAARMLRQLVLTGSTRAVRLTSSRPDPRDIHAETCRLRSLRDEVVVIVDDDPTGTQTLAKIDVVARWDDEFLVDLMRTRREFFILANTRALPSSEAQRLACEIATGCRRAADQQGSTLTIISRSDSTLRGHFPDEVYALVECSGLLGAQIILAPAFFEAGRVTIDNVHYLQEDGVQTPVADTPFAKDESFGYLNSNLFDWVVERSSGAIRREEVASITAGHAASGPSAVAEHVLAHPEKRVFVANATGYDELDVIAAGCLLAETKGATLIYRAGASFVRSRIGRGPTEPLTTTELGAPAADALPGGLVICGSHVPLSSIQLERLFLIDAVEPIELHVTRLLAASKRRDELTRVCELAKRATRAGKTAAIFTSRELLTTESEDAFTISVKVSSALVEFLQLFESTPAFIVAKGGITSSDLATKALEMQRAYVLGQIAPGVSVWRLLESACDPALPYVVFPGNVGGPDTLAAVVTAMIRWANRVPT